MQELALYQIIIAGVVFLLIFRTLILFLRKRKSIRELILALFIWGIIGLIALFPNIINIFAEFTGFQEGTNALVIVCLIIIFYIILSHTLKIDKLENSITRLIRQQAIEEFRNKYLEKNKN